MYIGFVGRLVRVETGRGITYFSLEEVAIMAQWVKDHEFELIAKQRESEQREEEWRQRVQAEEKEKHD